MLVGNKLDLVLQDPSKRAVSQQEARELCSQMKDINFIETSCVTFSNVKEAFGELVAEIYSKQQDVSKFYYERETFKIDSQKRANNNSASGCCYS